MVRCSDASLYTGWTNNLCKRLQAHNSGKGAKYTRARRPVTLAAQWRFLTASEARIFEAECKKLTRPQKLKLLS
jgi:putative endonuclease